MTLQFGRCFCKFLASVVFPPFVTLNQKKKKKKENTEKEDALKEHKTFKTDLTKRIFPTICNNQEELFPL